MADVLHIVTGEPSLQEILDRAEEIVIVIEKFTEVYDKLSLFDWHRATNTKRGNDEWIIVLRTALNIAAEQVVDAALRVSSALPIKQ